MADGANLSNLPPQSVRAKGCPIQGEWIARTCKPMFDGIDATVLLGILVTEQFERHRPARLGRLVGGSVAQVLGTEGREVPAGHPGCGDLPGPTGCPYQRGAKQAHDAQDG